MIEHIGFTSHEIDKLGVNTKDHLQQTGAWCWAASVSCTLRIMNVRKSQETIVKQIYGEVNRKGGGNRESIIQTLQGVYPSKRTGKKLQITVGRIEKVDGIFEHLRDKRPVLIARPIHALVIYGCSYDNSIWYPSAEHTRLNLWDPLKGHDELRVGAASDLLKIVEFAVWIRSAEVT